MPAARADLVSVAEFEPESKAVQHSLASLTDFGTWLYNYPEYGSTPAGAAPSSTSWTLGMPARPAAEILTCTTVTPVIQCAAIGRTEQNDVPECARRD